MLILKIHCHPGIQ